MIPVRRMTRRQFAALIGTPRLRPPIGTEVFGPWLLECPACLVDDTSDKVIADLIDFQNHVARHLKHIYRSGLYWARPEQIIATLEQHERDHEAWAAATDEVVVLPTVRWRHESDEYEVQG